ncbi:hypothetical protein CDV55_104986 [Aspergillus turcosus]|nr:hypothetical protein CDV55_104986 [Aspergillus turcosus]
MKAQTCKAIEKMVVAKEQVVARCNEWNGHGLFTVEKLERAVQELTFCNLDIQESPTICSGADIASIIPIKAPDRRPSQDCDSTLEVQEALFPTFEKVKLCADAKYFHPIACGSSLVDEGILRAIADAGNDVMIGDYSEAATDEILSILQKTGAAALAFLRACNLAGILHDWHMDILVAAHVQFRVLGYFRNHAVPILPEGLYGSRMTELTTHRHIDIANAVGVVAASLATGQQLNESEYMKLSYGTTLINDLVDLRSDTMRRQRENPVLRGVRGSACQYINKQILSCLLVTTELVETKQLLAMVTMAFCNWTVMASHHKLYELIHETRDNPEVKKCNYDGLEEQYDSTNHHDTYPFIAHSTHHNHKVLITGASRGIGLATAHSFARAGAPSIAIAARGPLDAVETALLSTAKEAGHPPPTILKLTLDVTDEASVAAAAARVTAEFGHIDILINNAGTSETWVPIAESDPADWWGCWEVNVKGVYLVMQAFIPLLRKGTQKTIVNVSSIGALRVRPGASAYQTGKFAVLRLTEFVMAEYAGEGMLAYAIHPGGVPTELAKGIKALQGFLNETPELAGDAMSWLTQERREWLGGRYVSVTWDMEELLQKREEIVREDKLKMRLVV